MNLSLIPDNELLEANKELALSYTRAQIELTKEPNNLMIKQALYNYEIELDNFKEELVKRNLIVS